MSFSERLSELLCEDGINSNEDREIVQFGLESIKGNLTGVFLTLLVGIVVGDLLGAVFFYVLFFPIRKSVGGFHAKTQIRCLFMSAGILAIAFILFYKLTIPVIFSWMSFVTSACLIFVLAPVDNPTKPFDNIEFQVYRKRSRIILMFESILYVFAVCLSWDTIIRSINIVFFVSCISLIMGKIKNAVTSKTMQM